MPFTMLFLLNALPVPNSFAKVIFMLRAKETFPLKNFLFFSLQILLFFFFFLTMNPSEPTW